METVQLDQVLRPHLDISEIRFAVACRHWWHLSVQVFVWAVVLLVVVKVIGGEDRHTIIHTDIE